MKKIYWSLKEPIINEGMLSPRSRVQRTSCTRGGSTCRDIQSEKRETIVVVVVVAVVDDNDVVVDNDDDDHKYIVVVDG